MTHLSNFFALYPAKRALYPDFLAPGRQFPTLTILLKDMSSLSEGLTTVNRNRKNQNKPAQIPTG